MACDRCKNSSNTHNKCIDCAPCFIDNLYYPNQCDTCMTVFHVACSDKNLNDLRIARENYIAWFNELYANTPSGSNTSKAIWPSKTIRTAFTADWCHTLSEFPIGTPKVMVQGKRSIGSLHNPVPRKFARKDDSQVCDSDSSRNSSNYSKLGDQDQVVYDKFSDFLQTFMAGKSDFLNNVHNPSGNRDSLQSRSETSSSRSSSPPRSNSDLNTAPIVNHSDWPNPFQDIVQIDNIFDSEEIVENVTYSNNTVDDRIVFENYVTWNRFDGPTNFDPVLAPATITEIEESIHSPITPPDNVVHQLPETSVNLIEASSHSTDPNSSSPIVEVASNSNEDITERVVTDVNEVSPNTDVVSPKEGEDWFTPPPQVIFDFPNGTLSVGFDTLNKDEVILATSGNIKIFRPQLKGFENPLMATVLSHSRVFVKEGLVKPLKDNIFDLVNKPLAAKKLPANLGWTKDVSDPKTLKFRLSNASKEILHFKDSEEDKFMYKTDFDKFVKEKLKAAEKDLNLNLTSNDDPDTLSFLETMKAPALKKEHFEISGPLENKLRVPDKKFLDMEEKSRKDVLQFFTAKSVLELAESLTSQEHLKDLNLGVNAHIHLSMINGVINAVTKLLGPTSINIAEDFFKTRNLISSWSTAGIVTKSVKENLTDATPFTPNLWSRETREKTVSAARQAQNDKTFFVHNKPVVTPHLGNTKIKYSNFNGTKKSYADQAYTPTPAYQNTYPPNFGNNRGHSARGGFRGGRNGSTFRTENVSMNFNPSFSGKDSNHDKNFPAPYTKSKDGNFHRGGYSSRGQSQRGHQQPSQRGYQHQRGSSSSNRRPFHRGTSSSRGGSRGSNTSYKQ